MSTGWSTRVFAVAAVVAMTLSSARPALAADTPQPPLAPSASAASLWELPVAGSAAQPAAAPRQAPRQAPAEAPVAAGPGPAAPPAQASAAAPAEQQAVSLSPARQQDHAAAAGESQNPAAAADASDSAAAEAANAAPELNLPGEAMVLPLLIGAPALPLPAGLRLIARLSATAGAAAPTATPPAPTPEPAAMPPATVGPAVYPELLSNSLFLYSPSVLSFDIQGFLNGQPGPLKNYAEDVDGQHWSAARIIAYNAANFGLNPQLLLVAADAATGVISNADAPVPSSDVAGPAWPPFFTWSRWFAHNAQVAYDLARFKSGNDTATFPSGWAVTVPGQLNPGTTAIQIALAPALQPSVWVSWVQGDNPIFVQRFREWFGSPYADPDANANPALPASFVLPFAAGETWFMSGGPHSYDGEGERPWSSLDFAPPEQILCPGGETPMDDWVVASESGTVIEATEALVVIDHGNGWRTYYSHVSTPDRVAVGAHVDRGQPIGHPSCEVEQGGRTSGAHVHFAIWRAGLGFVDIAGDALSGWQVTSTYHYDGYLTKDGATRHSEDYREVGLNDVTAPPAGG